MLQVHGDGGAATDDLLGAMSAARRGNAEPLCALAQRLAEEVRDVTATVCVCVCVVAAWLGYNSVR